MAESGEPLPEPSVDSVGVTVYTIPTDAPEADGTYAWKSTTLVLVEVGAAGRVGTGWTYGPAAVARIVADMLREVVVDRSVWDTTGSFAAMVAAIRNVGRPGVASCAISAVDTALWDLKARLLQLPLSALLGRVREEVAVYGSGGFTTYDETQLTPLSSSSTPTAATAASRRCG